jgi:enterobactin synthetase component F
MPIAGSYASPPDKRLTTRRDTFTTSSKPRFDGPGEVARTAPAGPPLSAARLGVNVKLVSPSDVCLHRLFEAQARREPGSVAVRGPGVAVTYEELDARASRLAGQLAGCLGVRPGAVVAVAMSRSSGLVASVLAVLKAGAAYLPIDPADPPARVRGLLDDARPALVLTLASAAGALPAEGARVVCVDDGATVLEGCGETPPAPDVAAWPGAPACLVATSGTTGRPKCVVLTHRGLARKVRWEHAELGIRPGDRFLHLASVGFSVAVLELFSPLCAGAELVLGPAGRARDAHAIAGLVRDHGVTVLSVVPSELALLLQAGGEVDWSSVRMVLTGGESLPAATARAFLAAHPGVSLVNLYGMTEASVDVAAWPCRTAPDEGSAPVGGPVAGVRAHLLDDDLRPVAEGAPGELFIGGDDLAAGYAGRPALTAERFLPDPSRPGGRLYRTGDLARRLPDGALAVLGRRDRQVQVHGIRVEPEEIEAVLSTHPSVSRAAVVLRRPAAEAAAPRDVAGWARLLQRIDEPELDRILAEIERRGAG